MTTRLSIQDFNSGTPGTFLNGYMDVGDEEGWIGYGYTFTSNTPSFPDGVRYTADGYGSGGALLTCKPDVDWADLGFFQSDRLADGEYTASLPVTGVGCRFRPVSDRSAVYLNWTYNGGNNPRPAIEILFNDPRVNRNPIDVFVGVQLDGPDSSFEYASHAPTNQWFEAELLTNGRWWLKVVGGGTIASGDLGVEMLDISPSPGLVIPGRMSINPTAIEGVPGAHPDNPNDFDQPPGVMVVDDIWIYPAGNSGTPRDVRRAFSAGGVHR